MLAIIICYFTIFYGRFDWSKINWNLISRLRNGMYDFHEVWNDLRTLKFRKYLENLDNECGHCPVFVPEIKLWQ